MKTKLLLGLLAMISSVTAVIMVGPTSYASNAWNYNAGHIIDDSVFTNWGAMTVTDIHNFLNSKVPNCDNWGQQQSELGGGTRAQWLAAHGISTPITCLRDYYENPSTGQNNYGKAIPSGGISAADIIYNYSRQFQINPEVILTTLQKENGLVTDSWPTPREYTQAMGFGCPDNVAPGAPACDPNYGSFSAQIYQAARHFRGFMDNQAGWYIPFTTGNNYIAWSPNSSCGGSRVWIDNRATVALYSYTPYQPNAAAKSAQYGTGDGCSAYGNRNFYLYFTDWFGSTLATVSVSSSLRVSTPISVGYYTKEPITVSFDVTNTQNFDMGIGSMTVTVRDSKGNNFDYPLHPMLIRAHSTVTYQATQSLPSEETYTFGIVNYNGGVWDPNYPGSSNLINPRQVTVGVTEAPTQTSNIVIGSELRNGKDTPVSVTVKNNSASSLNLGQIGIGVRGPSGENFDLPTTPVTLAAGQTYTYQQMFRPQREGSYTFFIVDTLNGGVNWESNFPLPFDSTINGSMNSVAKPGITITQSVQSSAITPRTGINSTLSFNVKNYGSTSVDLGKLGLMGRDPQGQNVDTGLISVVLAPGEERVISFATQFNIVGTYNFQILETLDSGVTWSAGPPIEQSTVAKSLSVSVLPSLTLTQGPMLQSNALYQGSPNSLSVKVKNYGSTSVDLGKLGLMGRDPQGQNVDPGITPVVLAAGEERIVSFNFQPSKSGTYSFGVISTKDNGASWQDGPALDSVPVTKTLTASAKPNVTITSSPSLSLSSIHSGEAGMLSFKVMNHSSASIDIGKLGFWGRDPQGQNVDPGITPVVLAAGEERIVSFNFQPSSTGNYQFGILQTKDNGVTWSNGPNVDSPSVSQNIAITVKSATTITAGVSVTPSSVTVGTQASLSFNIKNYSSLFINIGKLGFMGRGPQGQNVDPGITQIILAPGEEKVISFNVTPSTVGTYTYALLGTMDNGRTWNIGYPLETNTQQGSVSLSVVP